MSVIVFDNLEDQEFRWSGPLAGHVQNSQSAPTRARDLARDKRLRHLTSYAPEFFKYCEVTFDLAIFYIADPDANARLPLSVWQARGYWIGTRSRFAAAELRHRNDDRNDSLTFCEGEKISNLLNGLDVHDIDPAVRQNAPSNWLTQITNTVYSYLNNPNGKLNPNGERHRTFAQRTGITNLDSLRLSGFSQSRRACKIRFGTIQFMVFAKQLAQLIHSLSEMLAIINDADREIDSELMTIGAPWTMPYNGFSHRLKKSIYFKILEFNHHLDDAARLSNMQTHAIANLLLKTVNGQGLKSTDKSVQTLELLCNDQYDFTVKQLQQLFEALIGGLQWALKKAHSLLTQIEASPNGNLVKSVNRNSRLADLDQFFGRIATAS